MSRMTSYLVTGGAGVIVLVLGFGGCRREGPAPNIVLITIDTLRADHLGIYGYERQTSPRIDEFFGGGRVYERAYAAQASTTPSVVSLLTGLLPQHHGVRMHFQPVPEETRTVARRLGEAGYQTAAVVSNGVLTAEACALDRQFDYYQDVVNERELYREAYERRAAKTTDAALEWLATVRDPERPHFLWLHYMDPHAPYSPPEDKPREFSHEGERPLGEDRRRVYSWKLHPGIEDGLEYIDLYDEEIAYTDRELGRFLDAYQSAVGDADTFFMFTADHGEALMDHERWFAHGYNVYEEIVRVPLMIRHSSVSSGRVAAPVSLLDVAPTLLEVAHQEPEGELDGVSLFLPGDPDREILTEAATPRVRRRSGQTLCTFSTIKRVSAWVNIYQSRLLSWPTYL